MRLIMQNKLINKLVQFSLISSFFISPDFGHTEILFEDNFDNHPDWTVTQQLYPNRISCTSTETCSTPPPTGYAGYTVQGSPYTPVGHNTININSDNHRGTTGKGLTMWNESGATTYWWSDGLLVVTLPQEYSELYVQFYVKFQSNWEWADNGKSLFQKMFRIAHCSNYNEMFNMQPYNQPMVISDLYKGNSGQADLAISNAYREEPNYYMSSPYNYSAKSFFGDGGYAGSGTGFYDSNLNNGDWHLWEFRVKINSAPGVCDGIHEFWQDGILVHSKTDIPWIDTGGKYKKWNIVMLGGNSFNHFSTVEEAKEQWYAIDDFVISTTPINNESPLPTIKDITFQ